MNIITRTYSGKYIVRPDTTWERDNEDFYPPEFISSLSYTPVLFARISKPGRSIGKPFAGRYYDSVSFGVLLYPEDILGPSEEDFACASCIDHTSFLTLPATDKAVFNWDDHFMIERNGSRIFESGRTSADMIEKAIEESTKYIYIRSGDLLALELRSREQLCSREDGTIEISSKIGERPLGDFRIIF